ncbi:hypothetical protein [Asaia bogorensis]|uniref:hypothetical protein n=1 Tax=Asaia bogorensis TaxID=91915 RepID=UPI000EFB65BF|nr:hypothetical protein [Asaia bogorensis]
MTHEQKPESAEFRTREEAIASLAFHLHEATCDVCWSIATIMAEEFILKAEARGAAEQRRKDAEGAEPVAWLIEDRCKGDPRRAHTPDSAVTDKAHADKAARFNFKVSALYSRPANITTLGASFAWLVEDMREKDQGAPPSARFDMLFGNDEVSISEARERLEALGIESLYITDEWADATEGNELSCAEVEALPPLHEDEQKAGWKLASAWDTEDGTIIRHYVRPLRISDQDPANVAALEARVKELEGYEKDAIRFRWLVEKVSLYYGIPGFAVERGRSYEKRVEDLLRAIDANIERSAAAIRKGEQP